MSPGARRTLDLKMKRARDDAAYPPPEPDAPSPARLEAEDLDPNGVLMWLEGLVWEGDFDEINAAFHPRAQIARGWRRVSHALVLSNPDFFACALMNRMSVIALDNPARLRAVAAALEVSERHLSSRHWQLIARLAKTGDVECMREVCEIFALQECYAGDPDYATKNLWQIPRAFLIAAENGHLNMLAWLRRNFPPHVDPAFLPLREARAAAMAHGHSAAAIWLAHQLRGVMT